MATDPPPNTIPPAKILAHSESLGVAAAKLATELATAFADHVRRAMKVELDHSETSLAFVDHYLQQARQETRGPILELLAAEAGAYYGEVIRRTLGAAWLGDGHDPRRLRLLMADQFLYFAPVDQALSVVIGPLRDTGELLEGDPPDSDFHAHPRAPVDQSDAAWLAERLAELPPVEEQEYFTLTCRYETLKLILELLAARHGELGEGPRTYGIADYLDALTQAQA